tara:strand:- start:6460 stop:6783 length:324 start_codon:yes stop_codon:yes gene_type:complete
MDTLPDDILRTISCFFSPQDNISNSLITTNWNQLLTTAVKFSRWKLQPLCNFFPRLPAPNEYTYWVQPYNNCVACLYPRVKRQNYDGTYPHTPPYCVNCTIYWYDEV